MAYSIKQTSQPVTSNRWQWQAWIDAQDSELDQVKEVTWYLHETFPNPIIKKVDRKSQFKIKQVGWGIFLLYADVNLKNGETIALTHQLSFSTEEQVDAVKKEKKIFLSYGAEDSELAVKVSKNLKGQGYDVLDLNDVNPGMPFKLAQQQLQRESDLIVGLVTSDVTSPFVLDDLNRAEQSNKEAVALIGKNVKPLGLNPKLKKVSFTLESDDADAMFNISLF